MSSAILNCVFPDYLKLTFLGFRSRYGSQHALSNLLFNLMNCLEKSGVVGTIIMELLKALVCLALYLIIAKQNSHILDEVSG